MGTPFVWISEAVTHAHESLAVPNFLDILRDTPMLPWTLRLLGAQMGRGFSMNTTDLTAFDCTSTGTHASPSAHRARASGHDVGAVILLGKWSSGSLGGS
jgi:hypothetical protein